MITLYHCLNTKLNLSHDNPMSTALALFFNFRKSDIWYALPAFVFGMVKLCGINNLLDSTSYLSAF